MKKLMIAVLVVSLALTMASCAMQQKKVEKEMKQPINCATAEGDLRALEKEKAHVGEKIAEGVTAIVPMSLWWWVYSPERKAQSLRWPPVMTTK